MIKLLDESANFYGKNGNPFLVRCPSCHQENYGPNVVTGICTWCGWSEEVEANAETINKEIRDV